MEIKYIDIHSHLNLSPLSENKEAILAKMRELGVATITVGTGLATSRDAVKIAEENTGWCFATVGIHPCHACGGEAEEYNGEELEKLAVHPAVVAIGETGLDYFHEDTPESRSIQEDVFKKHIALAAKVGKSLMLHVRASKGSDDAYYDALEVLNSCNYSGKANFHFFSGSRECMEKIVEAGYTVSVDGPITFTNEYDEMIKAVPLDKIMIETDAPFAAPKPYRGKPCEPWMVIEVAKRIAELKGLDEEEVRTCLLENAKAFFGLDF
ncbi:MAG: sec-independent protein translocase protein TatD DNase family protein [Patescibacteria group bacterium]|nr:sec-independent protein translocase protein TatD DNase family protein [Patescibacteria group bacterium]